MQGCVNFYDRKVSIAYLIGRLGYILVFISLMVTVCCSAVIDQNMWNHYQLKQQYSNQLDKKYSLIADDVAKNISPISMQMMQQAIQKYNRLVRIESWLVKWQQYWLNPQNQMGSHFVGQWAYQTKTHSLLLKWQSQFINTVQINLFNKWLSKSHYFNYYKVINISHKLFWVMSYQGGFNVAS